jgi:hypothetical protein
MGAQQPGNGIGARKLRTIDQSEAFLRSERQRREIGNRERLKTRDNLATD